MRQSTYTELLRRHMRNGQIKRKSTEKDNSCFMKTLNCTILCSYSFCTVVNTQHLFPCVFVFPFWFSKHSQKHTFQFENKFRNLLQQAYTVHVHVIPHLVCILLMKRAGFVRVSMELGSCLTNLQHCYAADVLSLSSVHAILRLPHLCITKQSDWSAERLTE